MKWHGNLNIISYIRNGIGSAIIEMEMEMENVKNPH